MYFVSYLVLYHDDHVIYKNLNQPINKYVYLESKLCFLKSQVRSVHSVHTSYLFCPMFFLFTTGHEHSASDAS